jgi:hypothetical protein
MPAVVAVTTGLDDAFTVWKASASTAPTPAARRGLMSLREFWVAAIMIAPENGRITVCTKSLKWSITGTLSTAISRSVKIARMIINGGDFKVWKLGCNGKTLLSMLLPIASANNGR